MLEDINLSIVPSLARSLFLTLLAGEGLSEELGMFPFSHMLLILRMPPVGISATRDLEDLTSLFPYKKKRERERERAYVFKTELFGSLSRKFCR